MSSPACPTLTVSLSLKLWHGWSHVSDPSLTRALLSHLPSAVTYSSSIPGNISIVSDELSFTLQTFIEHISVIMHKVVRLSQDSLESEGRDSLDSSHQSSDSLMAINDSLGRIAFV